MKSLLRTILGILLVIVCIKVIMLLVILCYVGFIDNNLFSTKPTDSSVIIEKVEKETDK
jgi:hypothetical protein